MVGKGKPHTLMVDTSSSVKHEQMLLSPTSSHSSDYSDNASTSNASFGSDQRAIIKCEDNFESTSSNDRSVMIDR
jgi:hypothetical protein